MKKRKIKKSILFLILLLIISIFIFIVKNSKKEIKSNNKTNEKEEIKQEKYSDLEISIMNQKYYVKENLDRYLNYETKLNLEDFTSLDEETRYIISMVNSNRDFDYYNNVQNTDLSKGFLILVNKYNKLDSDYIPDDLVLIESKYGISSYLNKNVYEEYKKMWNAAKEENLNLYIRSPYRSYDTQNKLYERYAQKDGYDKADTYSARAGYSEHQTGLAFDVTTPDTSLGTFEGTDEFYWLEKNAYKYGFILRYPKGKEDITGYMYESWHYRYVGKEAAKYIYENNITFEEYYEYFIK